MLRLLERQGFGRWIQGATTMLLPNDRRAGLCSQAAESWAAAVPEPCDPNLLHARVPCQCTLSAVVQRTSMIYNKAAGS